MHHQLFLAGHLRIARTNWEKTVSFFLHHLMEGSSGLTGFYENATPTPGTPVYNYISQFSGFEGRSIVHRSAEEGIPTPPQNPHLLSTVCCRAECSR